VRDYARDRFGSLNFFDNVEEIAGAGVRTFIDAVEVKLGSPDFCNVSRLSGMMCHPLSRSAMVMTQGGSQSVRRYDPTRRM